MKYRTLKDRAPALEPPCRKTIYHSKEEAEDMIRHIRETRVTRDIRAYQCDICGFWHLTSSGR